MAENPQGLLKPEPEPKLADYDAMCAYIERVATVDEVKEIRQQAKALAAYYKEALNIENTKRCEQIRIRAERRAGEILREQAKNGERVTHKDAASTRVRRGDQPTLANYGITYDQSADWQRLAAIPKEEFELELESRPGIIPTTGAILAKHYPKPKEPDPLEGVTVEALDTWGRLMDMGKLLVHDPRELFRTMTVPMREDVLRLAPKVSSWLDRFQEE